MSSPRAEPRSPRAINVKVTRQALAVDLADGRTLVVPIAWYPRLLHGTPAERSGSTPAKQSSNCLPQRGLDLPLWRVDLWAM